MVSSPHTARAIVRGIPSTFDDCIKPPESKQPIDLALAREQHRSYCSSLRGLGIRLIELEADECYPDCTFVEDTAIVAGETAVIARFGVAARAGEETAVEAEISRYERIVTIEPPATIEGGDVLKIDTTLFVGITSRTNREGAAQLERAVAADGFSVVPVPVTGVFHLKSAVTYLGNGHIALASGHFDESIFKRFAKIAIPPEETYATNCLAANDAVLVSAGFPRTRDRIQSAGFTVIETQSSEFKKAGGSLTCLSILL
jgi:dimethylargininase